MNLSHASYGSENFEVQPATDSQSEQGRSAEIGAAISYIGEHVRIQIQATDSTEIDVLRCATPLGN